MDKIYYIEILKFPEQHLHIANTAPPGFHFRLPAANLAALMAALSNIASLQSPPIDIPIMPQRIKETVEIIKLHAAPIPPLSLVEHFTLYLLKCDGCRDTLIVRDLCR